MEEFKGKVVLITGSSGGLGAGMAVYLAARGARLSLTGRDDSKLRGVAQRCQEAGLNPNDILTTVGDLTEETFRTQLVSRTVDKFGQLDVLVNNAGGPFYGKLGDAGMENFLNNLNLNVIAVVSVSKLAVPHLLRSKGNIVNISSISSVITRLDAGGYCVSKAALDMFTKTLALELAPKGVRVNSVNPGHVPTENTLRRWNVDSEQFEAIHKRLLNKYPIGRLGKLEDIARAVAFLASDKSSFITGETLFVDGGARYGGL